MAQLSFSIQTVSTIDFDDNPIDVKEGCAFIDGVKISVEVFAEDIANDDDIKQELRDNLTDLGYTWDSEA